MTQRKRPQLLFEPSIELVEFFCIRHQLEQGRSVGRIEPANARTQRALEEVEGGVEHIPMGIHLCPPEAVLERRQQTGRKKDFGAAG